MDLASLLSAWPFAASLAVALVAGGARGGRRRRALNEALHELRRPLQALALAAPGTAPALDSSLRMAGEALERLDGEINGRPPRRAPRSFPVRPLLEEVAERWRARSGRTGGGAEGLELRWEGPPAALDGDRGEIERALDNLLANAFEHGGPRIAISAAPAGGCLRLAVVDRGGTVAPHAGASRVAPLRARLTGRHRRGHGLRVVRRVAAAHGGAFDLCRAGSATEAVLRLPLAAGSEGAA